MKQVTILHITSSLKRGGAESILCDIIEQSDTLFKHHVIYFHDGPYVDRLQKCGVQLYKVNGLFFRYDFIFLYRLYCFVKKIKPDCIHTLLWAANVTGRIVARLLGIPVVSALHNNVDQDGLIRSLIDRYTLQLSHKLVAVSDGVAQSLRRRDPWIPATKIQVIQNGIDTKRIDDIYHNNNARDELGLSENHFVIGSVGRFVPLKNYGFLLEQMALLCSYYSHVHLVLIGTGPQEQELRKKAQNLGIAGRVSFLINRQALQYYSLFDCFVLTSPKEGISIALLEAMAFGLPSVVTNAADGHAVLRSGVDGLVIPAGDSDLFVVALRQLIENDALRVRLGTEARRTVVAHFNLERMIRDYQKLFLMEIRNSSL